MGRDTVTGWAERYEQAWRAQDVDGRAELVEEREYRPEKAYTASGDA